MAQVCLPQTLALLFAPPEKASIVVYNPIKFIVAFMWRAIRYVQKLACSEIMTDIFCSAPHVTNPNDQPHGKYSVPEYDIESTPEPSREGSVQIVEWTPARFSAPAVGSETESESGEEDREDVEIASSNHGENRRDTSAATTPEQRSPDKDGSTKSDTAEGKLDDFRGAKSPRPLSSIVSPKDPVITCAAVGTSQLNPIDLEGTQAYDVGTESEDEGPEVIPIEPEAFPDGQKTSRIKAMNVNTQHQMPVFENIDEDDMTDSETDLKVQYVIEETQANKNIESVMAETEELESESESDSHMSSIADATDGLDTEDMDEMSHVDDYSDSEQDMDYGSDIGDSVPLATTLQDVSTEPDSAPKDMPKPVQPVQDYDDHYQHNVVMSDTIDLSPPNQIYQHPRLTPEPRAPSPSDAALARKGSDRVVGQDQRHTGFLYPAYTPNTHYRSTLAPGFHGMYDSDKSYVEFSGLQSPELPPSPYHHGPFSTHDTMTTQESLPALHLDNPFMTDQDFIQSSRQTATPYAFMGRSNGYYDEALRKSSERQSSKMNISSIVDGDPVRHPVPSKYLKRKAEDISSGNDDEELIFATAPTALRSTSPPNTSRQSPPPSNTAMPETIQTQLPDAQFRDSSPKPEAVSLTQESVSGSLLISVKAPAITVEPIEIEEPRRKKARTASSASGGIGKFVSGVCFGVVGALAAFVATIPASVRDEALQELSSGI